MKIRAFAVLAGAAVLGLVLPGCAFLHKKPAKAHASVAASAQASPAPSAAASPAVVAAPTASSTSPGVVAASTTSSASPAEPDQSTPLSEALTTSGPSPVNPAGGHTVDQVIAMVDGDPITMSDAKAFALQAGKPLPDQSGPARDQEMRQILKALVADKLLESELKRYQDKVDDEQVDKYIDDIKQRAGVDDAGFRAELQSHGVTVDQYRQKIRLQLEKMQMIQDQVRGKVSVSDSEIEAYYKSHPDEFTVSKEKYKLAQILIAVPPNAPAEQVAAARKKAEDIRKRAAAGEDFAQLAAQYSDDDSKSKGGELGEFAPGDLIDQIADAVRPLKAGQVTEVVQSRHGFHILKVEAHDLPGTRPLSDVSDDIHQKLENQAMMQEFQSWIEHDLVKQHNVEMMY